MHREGSIVLVKARLHRRFLSQQLNAIFVAPELQPAAISLRFSVICHCKRQYTSIA